MSEDQRIDMRQYGRLEAQVEHLTQKVDSMEKNVKAMEENVQAMRDLMEQGKGGWRVLVWVAGVVGTLGGGLGWFISHIKWGA